jgi:hypothetical protein
MLKETFEYVFKMFTYVSIICFLHDCVVIDDDHDDTTISTV